MPESIWKTDEPLVSIIVPVYNAAPDLATCIESARRQRYQNIEILLVNDGSSDASLDICRMYAQRDPRFHVIDKENSGVSATRVLSTMGSTASTTATGRLVRIFWIASSGVIPRTE